MTRWRFWAAQFVWAIALIAGGMTAFENGTDESIPFALLIGFVLTGFILKWGSTKQEQRQESGLQSYMIPRLLVTGFMWLMYLAGIFISVSEIGGWAIVLALVLMIPLIAVSALIWSWERISGVKDAHILSASENQEKRKRDRIDTVLRDLSSEDLMRLRERLADGTVDDELLYNGFVGDDGELVWDEK
jgi:hypothetical protein